MSIPQRYHETKKFIRKVQHADLAVRRKWFVGGTVATMLLVLLVWAAYLNLNIPSVASAVPAGASSSTAPEATTSAPAAPAKPGVLDTFGAGFDRIGQGLSDAYRSFSDSLTGSFEAMKERLGATNDISVQRNAPNFSFPGLETVPPTHLP